MTILKKNKRDVKQFIVSEIIKCTKDPIYFLETYGKVRHPQHGIIKFKLYEYQKKFIRRLTENRFNITLKSRQTGLSTITAAYVAWLLIFFQAKEVAVVSNNKKNAQGFIKKIKLIIKNCPEWMTPKITLDNQGSITLSNRSSVIAEATTSNAARSEALNLLIIDEAAAIDQEKVVDLWASAFPTLALGGNSIIISCVTPDTFVFTDKGIKEIGDFIDHGKSDAYQIDEYSVLGKDKLRSGNLFKDSGMANTRRLTTTNAYLEGSLEHKLWAYSSRDKAYGWYKLKDLTTDDYVSIQYDAEIWGNNDDVSGFVPIKKTIGKAKNLFKPTVITTDIAYMFGLYLSEGSCYKARNKNGKICGGNIIFTYYDDLKPALESAGIKVKNYDGLHHQCLSKQFIEFMEYVGFDLSRRATQKIIPSRLLEMSRENIVAMLQGIYDGDGFSRKDRGIVGIQLSSKRMIEQIRIILNNLGILTNYSEGVSKPTERVKVESNYHKLEITGSEAKKFYDRIGFRFDRKQNNRQTLETINFERANTKDVIPDSLRICKQMFENYGGSLNSLNLCSTDRMVLSDRTRYKTENVSRDVVIRIYDKLKKYQPAEFIEELEKTISGSLKWNKIRSIEDKTNRVCDFSLPDTTDFWSHSVIYNGILGHQTPRGVGNFYHQKWVDAENNESKFVPMKIHWTEHPEYSVDIIWECQKCKHEQETSSIYDPICDNCGGASLKPWSPWYDEQCQELGDPRKISQELDIDFLGSGENVIQEEYIKAAERNVKRPQRIAGFDNNLWIWEESIEDEQYMICSDVARGDGSDYSACHVIKLSNKEQVAEYKGMLPPDMYATFLVELGKEYNKALLVTEANSIGYATCLKIVELNYPNIYYSLPSHFNMKNKKKMVKELYDKDKMVPGFQTTTTTRPLAVSQLEEDIRNGCFIVHSTRLINEMRTFIWKNGKPQAMSRYNDDLVMAASIGLLIINVTLDEVTKSRELSKVMINSIGMSGIEATMVEQLNVANENGEVYNQWTMTDKFGNENDLTWLIKK